MIFLPLWLLAPGTKTPNYQTTYIPEDRYLNYTIIIIIIIIIFPIGIKKTLHTCN